MKWLVFILGVLGSYPVGRWLRGYPTLRVHVWTLVGLLPFYDSLDMALVFFGTRPGDTHGIEVALIDWLVLSLLFAHRGFARPLPYRFALTVYLLAVIVSVTQAQWTLGAVAYVWKLCRMYLLFAVVCRAGDEPGVPMALLRGMWIGIVYEGVLTAWQHFGLRLFQATGSFAHQNTLGTLMNLIVMVPIALVLAGPTTSLTKLVPAAAVPTALFTVSRGTLLFLGAGTALVLLGSTFRRYTVRKAKFGVIGLALAAALVPLAVTTLESRTAEERQRSMETRWQFESAASMMLEEHPLGIGPNNFTLMLLTAGYGERARVHWSQRLAIVHNVYLLSAVELGYAGGLALVVLFGAPLLSAIRYGVRASQDRRGDILLGLGVSLAVFYVHGLFEWVWRLTEVTYVYFMTIALVAVLSRQVRDGLAASAARRTPSGHRRPIGRTPDLATRGRGDPSPRPCAAPGPATS